MKTDYAYSIPRLNSKCQENWRMYQIKYRYVSANVHVRAIALTQSAHVLYRKYGNRLVRVYTFAEMYSGIGHIPAQIKERLDSVILELTVC